MRTSRHFWAAGAAALALAGSCSRLSRTAPLPELPKIAMENFLPAVREEVQRAYDAAHSQPRDAALNGKLGMVLHAHAQNAAAAACYERARLLDPKAFAWPYYLGVVYAGDGKYDQAAEAFRAALKLNPGYVPAQVRLAESLLAAGEVRKSGELYEKVLKAHPGNATAHYGLGRVRTAQGRIAEAAEFYRKACELFPAYGSAHYALVQAYRGLGRSDNLDQHLELYEKHKTDVPPITDKLIADIQELKANPLDLIRRGMDLERAGRLEEAVVEHEKALELNPEMAQAHVNLISLYGRLGEVEKAEQHYRAALAINPDQADCHYNYGVLCFGQGKKRQAKEAFRRAIEINPLYAEAHHNYAYSLEQEGRLEEAAQHYRTAIKNKPAYRLAHFHLARILVNRKQYEEAIGHLRKTLAPEDENTPGYLYALAAAYARSGDRQNALRYARLARDQASARGQTQLLASIDRDLKILEGAGSRR